MMTAHELFGFMSPDLAQEIVEHMFANEKPIYRLTLAAVAEGKKVRPAFLEKKPRQERHLEMISMLSRPRMEQAAREFLRAWLLSSELPLITDFLDGLGIPHQKGVVEDFPESVEEGKLAEVVEKLLAKYQREHVAVYLHAFNTMNETGWNSLVDLLQKHPQLQF
jgi:hypothetical protein